MSTPLQWPFIESRPNPIPAAKVGDYITDGMTAHGPVTEVGDGFYRVGSLGVAADMYWPASEVEVTLCRERARKACVLS